MKEEIEDALRSIIEQPLTDMWRYGGMQKFEFGEQRSHTNRRGEQVTRADLGLVVSCNWQITSKTGTIISQEDFVNDKEPRPSRVTSMLHELLSAKPTVINVLADNSGAVRLNLSGGYYLELSPDSTDSERDELWRFMPSKESEPHFVVTASGIEV